MSARVVRNDWSALAPPDLAGWRPTLPVSVVVPAFGDQATLDLVLAALAHQTYPGELLEVVVVDDGSTPPLRLPDQRPEHTSLHRVTDGWGKATALRLGVARAGGEILHLLDADMLVYPEHVAALARWHHVVPYAVTLGAKRFVDAAPPSPEQVARAWREGAADALFGGAAGQRHEYQERYIAQTDQLRAADHLAFRIFVGATVGLRRELYAAAGGPDPQLRFGNDTELGYRLAQAGAVFIPEPAARAWHLGPTHVMRAGDEIARYRQAFIADLVPLPRPWRAQGGTAWSVPLAQVTMNVNGQPLATVRAAVDSVLRGGEPDLRITLVGPWDALDPGRGPALADPLLEPRLIAATYRGEPRVRLATRAPETAFPSPYLVELPATGPLPPTTIGTLIDLADRHQAGVVTLGPEITLWRTAARGRAGWAAEPGESLLDAVTALHGRHDAPPTARGRAAAPARTELVEVEGVRSLARATVLVGRLGLRRVGRAVRRAWPRRGRRDDTRSMA